MKMVRNFKSLIIVASVIVFMLVAYYISAVFFEPKAYNFMVENFSTVRHGSSDIVLVVIDDKSLNRIRWPWKRELYSKIFEYMNTYSMAKVIGFDARIATPDIEHPDSDAKFYSSIKNIDNLVVGFVTLSTTYHDIEAGKRYDMVFDKKFGVDVEDKRKKKYSSYYNSISKFPWGYFESVKNVGSVMTTPDVDGYIRSMDQMVNYKGKLYPSLSMKIYDYLNPDNKYTVKDYEITDSAEKLKMPVFSNSSGVFSSLRFYKPFPHTGDTYRYSYKTYSAIDIMDSYDNLRKGKKPLISPQVFEDKIVFVGANAKAIAVGLEDVKRTPMYNDHPGVDIQATNLDNILNNDFLLRSSSFVDVLTLVVLLGAAFFVITSFSLPVSIGINGLLMILYLIVSAISYRFGFVISVITPILLQIVTMTIAYSYRFILEGRNKEKIQNAMGKYISQDVMQNVVRNIDGLCLGGKRSNVTVLFADIRGFTSMSEKMSAEEVSVILNEYFTEIEPIISKYNGVINKFIGDAVMAIFGEPIQDKNHATNAVKCANAMLKVVEKLQQKWIQEGKPRIEIGIGINTGEAFVGNIGSEKRLEYTVIGDMVNLASRIESYNKIYKTHFLISSTTYEKVRNIVDVIKISEVSIRGKAKKLDIYEVLRLVG